MKSSEILRSAAAIVEKGDCIGGCFGIEEAAERYLDKGRALEYFNRYFEPERHVGWWWPKERMNGPRIVGLCLAAAIAESEGD